MANTVKIFGKGYPIAPTMFAQVQFKRDKGKAVSSLKGDDVEDLMYYAYLCVKGAMLRDRKDLALSFEEFLAGVDGDPLDTLLEQKTEEVKKKRSLWTRVSRSLFRSAK